MTKKVFVKTPSGKVVKKTKADKPSQAKCSECGKVLHGIPRLSANKMHNLAKTKKRPERPYGGNLCSACSRKLIRSRV